jgi:modification methylase
MTQRPERSVSLVRLPTNVWLVGQEGSIPQRQGRYVPAVRGHPGKMLPALARRLVAEYTQPGDWILDPLSGIGTTGVEAVHQGRHYLGIEWEARFVAWQEANLKLAREQGATGQFTVLQADARRLDPDWEGSRPGDGTMERLVPTEGVAAVLTSPPYIDQLGPPGRGRFSPFVRARMLQGPCRPSFAPGSYGRGSENLGNLRGSAYWQAMRHVYTGCYQLLRPGGLLVTVLRPGRERHRLLPLHHETARLCQELGYELVDEVLAVFGRVVATEGEAAHVVNHASFWRRLATVRLREQGFPITLPQVEYVLIFRKPEVAPLPLPGCSADRAGPREPKNGLSAVLGSSLPSPGRLS